MAQRHLVGRERELHELEERLRRSRLVTVVGPGGVGKTALVQAGVARLASAFPSGARFVDLTRIEEEGAVAGAIAAQLGYDSFDGFLSAPVDDSSLLVIDNCEHLLDAVAAAVVGIFGAGDRTAVLATSRSPLELPGESVLLLAPLALPGPADDPASSPSVRLFLDRSEEAGAPPRPADLPTVAELCRRVDGLPLAIEIAAARARNMSVAEIVGRLDAAVDVLDRPRFRGDPRHRSVAETIAWSYGLLSAEARELFERLGVFAGPFTASTARSVAAAHEGEVTFDALLDELAYASLLSVDTSDPQSRYRLLETVRRFALDRLRAHGALDATYDRFVDHVLGSLRAILRSSTTTWRPGLLHDLGAAFDDLAEALRWSVAHDETPTRAFALCSILWGIVHQGRADDIVDLARRTLERWPDERSAAAAQCVATLATAEYVTGHPERALELVGPALRSLERPGLPSVTLRRVDGQARRALGDTEGALLAFRTGAQVGHELGMPAMAMELEIAAAIVTADMGDLDAGVRELTDLVPRARAAGSAITESWATAALGWLLLRADPTGALPLIEEGLAEARRIDYPVAVAVHLRSSSYAHLLLGAVAGALDAARALLDDLIARGALSNARLLVDVTAVLAHHAGHPGWPALAATARALPITTLVAAHVELVPLPPVPVPPIDRHRVIAVVRSTLEDSPSHSPSDSPSRSGVVPAGGDGAATPTARIALVGDSYEATFGGQTVSIRRSKGLDDIVRLIEADGREIHCLDLAGASIEERSTGAVIDDSARRQYEQRIRDLQEEIDEASMDNDLARADRAQVELDTLVEHLTRALGLGRRTRTGGGTVERARSAVTHRIKAALRQLDDVHPALARHLRHAVSTGTYCSYRPEHPIRWDR